MKVVDGFLEAVAADEPHGVIRAAVAISAQSVDGDDPGMLEAAGDLGLDEESVSGWCGSSARSSRICLRATSRSSSESRATKTAPSPPLAWGRTMRNRCPSEVAEPTETVPVRSGSSSSSRVERMRRADVPEGRLDVRTAGLRQAFASRPSDGQDGEALLDVAAMLLNMHAGDGLDSSPARHRGARARQGGRPGIGPCRASRRRTP